MTEKLFLPEFGSAPCAGGHRGYFRLFENEDWHRVRRDDGVEIFTCAKSAASAAREQLVAILNPRIITHRSHLQKFHSAVGDWFANKHEDKARDHMARKRGVREVVLVEIKSRKRG